MYKIILYGCGNNCKRLIDEGYFDKKIICFIDENKKGYFYDKEIYAPEKIPTKLIDDADYIIVTILSYEICEEVRRKLEFLGYPMSKVLFIYNTSVQYEKNTVQKQNDVLLRSISMELYEKEVCLQDRNCIISNLYDKQDEFCLIGKKEKFSNESYISDYCRYRTFEYVAKEIDRVLGDRGACAELGVFTGLFASLINEHFPRRNLYLFDTFEGFNEREYQSEINKKYAPKMRNAFKNTSVDVVLSNMKYKEKCIVRNGMFPSTITKEDLDLEFAFVSLDVDLEDSTFEGLKYFYPRLLEGGFIFLHDYHNHCYFGVKKALERYEKLINGRIIRVPISDAGGTCIITK